MWQEITVFSLFLFWMSSRFEDNVNWTCLTGISWLQELFARSRREVWLNCASRVHPELAQSPLFLWLSYEAQDQILYIDPCTVDKNIKKYTFSYLCPFLFFLLFCLMPNTLKPKAHQYYLHLGSNTEFIWNIFYEPIGDVLPSL